jgi:hypothetical protein
VVERSLKIVLLFIKNNFKIVKQNNAFFRARVVIGYIGTEKHFNRVNQLESCQF